MSTQITIPNPFGAVVNTTSGKLLSQNAARKFLQIQNKSAVSAQVTFKFDNDFIKQASGVQLISFNGTPNAGTFTVSFGGFTTPGQASNVSAATLQTAIQALTSVGANNALVTGTVAAGFTVTFAGTLANLPQPAMTVASSLTNTVPQQSCTQNLAFSQPPLAGTFVLADSGGNQTAALQFDVTALQLVAALNALPVINGSISNLTQDPVSKMFTIYFANAPLANGPVPLLTVVSSSLTNNTLNASCVQVLYAEPPPLQGQFALQFEGQITPLLNYNCAAADIQAALAYLPAIGVGNVTVTGTAFSTGFTITFGGALANTPCPLITLLTGENLIEQGSFSSPLGIQGLEPDLLQPPQIRAPGGVVTRIVITTPGVATANVTITPLMLQAGIAPTAVPMTVTVVTPGNATPIEGITVNAGDSLGPYAVAVPIGAVYAYSTADGQPVEVWEG